jgi:hypothetical protein
VYEVSFGEDVNPSGEGTFLGWPADLVAFCPRLCSSLAAGVVADDDDGMMSGDEVDEETWWGKCEEFIKAMLTNMDGCARLPVDRIQEILAMTFESYDRTLAELSQHLQAMVSADVLTFEVDGNYALKGAN